MAWRRLGDKPLSESKVVSLLTQICVIRPRWVKENHSSGGHQSQGLIYLSVYHGQPSSQMTLTMDNHGRNSIQLSTSITDIAFIQRLADIRETNETVTLSFWRNFYRWMHRKLSSSGASEEKNRQNRQLSFDNAGGKKVNGNCPNTVYIESAATVSDIYCNDHWRL